MSAAALQSAIEAVGVKGGKKLALMAIADNTQPDDTFFDVRFSSIEKWTGVSCPEKIKKFIAWLNVHGFIGAAPWVDDNGCYRVRGYLNTGHTERGPNAVNVAPAAAREIAWKPEPEFREFIYKRDGYKCHYCGSVKRLSLDHIVPRSKGGDHSAENLVTCCRSCNSEKGVKSYEEFMRGGA